MPHKKEYFDHDSHTTASDSDHEQQIRQAPYLPRVQVWARDDGPYTLRIGSQWFHCDDLVINGAEYRQRARKDAPQPRQPPSNQTVYPPPKSRRPAASRAQSYQRTRDRPSATAAPVIHQDPNRLASESQYQPQTLPDPKEQSERRRAERRRQKDAEAEKQAQLQQDRPRRDSGVSVSADAEAQSGTLVPWQPRPAMQRRASQQARTARPRPGRKGSSFDIPVRNKSRKNVRFAALP